MDTVQRSLKIKSVKSLGIQDVYDIEMPTAHNFVLSNGAVAHNCSHAVSYVHLSYACAYLKHHFPLEWWTAVLRNADKNEVSEKFWNHCGHLIKLPDIKLSKENFAIVNERIQAPTSLLQGIGATAHQELVEVSVGADNLEQLFQNIYLRRVNNGKDGKLGRSALHRSVMYTLIVSGTMDSMFPNGSTMLDKLMAYETARAVYEEMAKKKPETEGKKKTSRPRKAKVAEPVLPEFVNLSAFQIYQLRKSILPAYSEDLFDAICHTNFATKVGMGYVLPFGDRLVKLVKPKTIDDLNALETWQNGKQVVLGLPCYVQSDERRVFGPQKKEMAKLMLESCGRFFEVIKWPERGQTKLSEEFQSELTGSVGIAILSKYSVEKPFILDGFVTVQAPFKKLKEESSE
jgi:hypothetical protein